MKKRAKKCIFLAVACAAAAIAATAFAACGSKNTHTHDWGEWEETVAATCTTAGEEVRVCKTDSSHKETRTINAKGHGALTKTNEKPATCTDDGAEAYWTCPDCLQKFSDSEGKTAITAPAVIPAAHGELIKTDEKPATCTDDGAEAYWTCPDCLQKFSDEDGETAITAPAVIPASHAPLYHHEAVTATCESGGVQEYWLCLDCYQKFDDADGKVEISDEQLRTTPPDPAAHHALEHRAQVDATCTEDGTEEYWYCPGCLKCYSDEDGTNAIAEPVTIPAAHGTLVKVNAVQATCAGNGTEEYWYCEDCGQMFSDAEGTQKISKPVSVAVLAHTPGSVISGTTGGSITMPSGTVITQQNVDYYECEVCNKKFADAACTKEVTNPGKYVSRNGGGVLEQGNNLMCIPGVTMTEYFAAPEAGCYVLMFDNCTVGKVGYIALPTESLLGVTVYNTGWESSSIYIDRVAKSVAAGEFNNILYVDMQEGEVIFLNISVTANEVFAVNVEKLNLDESDNNLFIGTNSVTVREEEVLEGVEWVFTAPADDFYKLSVSDDSVAYVMKLSDGNKTAVLSATEERLSYVFSALQGEKFVFYMSADTMGGVEFPLTYTVTVENNVKFPEVAMNENTTVEMKGGYFDYEFMLNVESGQGGDYVFSMTPTQATGRNYYEVYVNGVKAGNVQATEGDNGVWELEILLAEGYNLIKISNATPMNYAGNVSISFAAKS